jgi:hypothetical protein
MRPGPAALRVCGQPESHAGRSNAKKYKTLKIHAVARGAARVQSTESTQSTLNAKTYKTLNIHAARPGAARVQPA